jgi:hypothetical protein
LRVTVTASGVWGSAISLSNMVGPVRAVPPVNLELPTISGEAVVGDGLQVSTGSWMGNTDVEAKGAYAYQWQACDASGENCSDIPEAAASGFNDGVYAPPATFAGSTIRVVVTTFSPTGEASASATSAATAVLADATPVASTAAPSISGTAQDGDALTAAPGAWTGSPSIVYTYQWTRCDVAGASCSPIAGATEAVYKAARVDIGQTLRVAVTATNGAGAASVTSAPTGTVAVPGVPTNITPPVLPHFYEAHYYEDYPGEPEFHLGEARSAVEGAWTGDPTVSYQWQRCDMTKTDPETAGPVCTDIPGATSIRYAPRPADIGYALQIVETATNQAGSASVDSGPSPETVPNTGVDWTQKPGTRAEEDLGGNYTGAAVVGQVITADSTVIAGFELPVTTTYEFLRVNDPGTNTVLQVGSNPSYTVTSEDLGHEIEVVMQVDVWRADKALVVESLTLMLYTHAVELPPTSEVLPTISGGTTAGLTLTTSEGSWNGGGGPLTYAYQWLRCDATGANCQSVAKATGPSYTTGPADVGSTLRVLVTATSEGAAGGATSSATSPITAAVPPTNTSPPSITGEPKALDTLTATPGTWTGSEPISYDYQWESCTPDSTECEPIASAVSATYTASEGDVGSALRVQVAAMNGAGTITAESYVTEPIGGAPEPVNTRVPTITLLGAPSPGAMITSGEGTWEHISKGSTYGPLSFQWQRCSEQGTECEDISGARVKSYEIAAADVNHRLRVIVTAETTSGRASAGSGLSLAIESGSGGQGSGSGGSGTEGERIVYTTKAALFIADTDGSNAHEAAGCASVGLEAGCEFAHPSISPNGEMLAAEVHPPVGGTCVAGICPKGDFAPNGQGRILLMNYLGGEIRVLAGGSQPTWAPGSATLTYTRDVSDAQGGQAAQLYSLDADGSDIQEPTPLDTGTAIAEDATYSPDGSELAFIGKTAAGEPWGLYVANRDGSEPERLPLGGLSRVDEPVFTEDGDSVVFDAVPGPEPFDPEVGSKFEPEISNAYEISTSGANLRQVTDNSEETASPTPLPGNKLLITTGKVTIIKTTGGTGVSISPPAMQIVSLQAGGTPTPVAGPPSGEGVTAATYGVLGPHAHAAEELCSQRRRVCGKWTAFDTEGAYHYAKEWHARDNAKWFFTYGNDCTNYVNQLLLNGMQELGAEREEVYDWWTKSPGLLETVFPFVEPPHSPSWSLAEVLYHHLLDDGLARQLKANETPRAGDIVFFHWERPKPLAPLPPINHVGMIVAGSNSDPSTEIYTQHTTPRFWHMTDEYKEIGKYLHTISKGKVAVTEDERGKWWKWYVLRPVHSTAWVPE